MQKKIPQRQCMGCRERKNKRDMIRVVRTTDNTDQLLLGFPLPAAHTLPLGNLLLHKLPPETYSSA